MLKKMPSGHCTGCLRFETLNALNFPKQSEAMTYFESIGVLREGLLRILGPQLAGPGPVCIHHVVDHQSFCWYLVLGSLCVAPPDC